MGVGRSSCSVFLMVAASCSDVTLTRQIDLDHGVSVATPASWSAERGAGRVLLRGAPRGGHVELVSALVADYGVERTPARVLAALRTQVASVPGTSALRAEPRADTVLLDWNDARGHARRHVARFLGRAIVHVSCTDIDPNLCDEIAAHARAEGPKPALSVGPLPATIPVYPRYSSPRRPPPPTVAQATEQRAHTNIDEYEAGLQARAERIEAQRASGVEVLP